MRMLCQIKYTIDRSGLRYLGMASIENECQICLTLCLAHSLDKNRLVRVLEDVAMRRTMKSVIV